MPELLFGSVRTSALQRKVHKNGFAPIGHEVVLVPGVVEQLKVVSLSEAVHSSGFGTGSNTVRNAAAASK